MSGEIIARIQLLGHYECVGKSRLPPGLKALSEDIEEVWKRQIPQPHFKKTTDLHKGSPLYI